MLQIKKLLLLINILFFNLLHSQQLKPYSNTGYSNQYNIEKERLLDLNKEAIKKLDSFEITKSLIVLSAFERYRTNYDQAFSYAGEALYISEKTKSTLSIAKANEEFAFLLHLYKQHKEAEKHFKKSHQLYTSLYKKGKLSSIDLFQSNYNMVMHGQHTKNVKEIKKYVAYCDTIIQHAKLPKAYNALLLEKRASIHQWEHNYKKAIHLLKQSSQILGKLPNNNHQNKVFQNFLFIVHARLGVIYRLDNQKQKANHYFNKALKRKDYTGENTFYKYFILKKHAAVLYELKNYKKAYESEAHANALGHYYWNPRNQKNSNFLTIENQFKKQLEIQNQKNNQKKLELTKINNKVLQLKSLLLIIILAFVVISTFVLYRIKSLKHEKTQNDSNELIKIKNKELITNTLQLIEKERVVSDVTNYLKENLNNTNSKQFLKRVQKNSSSLWDDFNHRFTQQNIGFYEKLQKKIPNLTAADLKLCALIKLNFSSKEMSYLLNISHGSVNVARHRLRTKMKLSKEVNLTEFINTI